MAQTATALREVSGESVLTSGNTIEFGYDSIDEAFPAVDPGIKPFGHVGIFQIRHPKRRTKGDIIIPAEARSTEHYNTQVAKVIALGPLCFKSTLNVTANDGSVSQELVDWPEGAWFKPGDFVHLPKYGGDRFTMKHVYQDFEIDPRTGRKERVTISDDIIFALFKVKDVIGLVTTDPLKIKAYLD